MQIGLIGLGKMGSRIALKLLEEGHDVVVWNRSQQPVDELKSQISPLRQGSAGQAKLKIAKDIANLVASLEKPRVVWLMLPAGAPTQALLDEVSQYLGKDDILIDGGNSNYQDTEKRFEKFEEMGIRYLGIGVSGGIIAAEEGYPLMAGGDKVAYEKVTPLLDSLAKPARHASKALRAGPRGGHAYFGTGGAGHFVKMVHNGVEYGMMQAISEGFAVLEKSPYSLDLRKVAKLWQKGTIVSSFLIDRAKDALEKDQKLSDSVGPVATSGEADWTLEAAKEEGVSIANIEQALEYRKKTQTDESLQESFITRMLNALRREFGGHEVKK